MWAAQFRNLLATYLGVQLCVLWPTGVTKLQRQTPQHSSHLVIRSRLETQRTSKVSVCFLNEITSFGASQSSQVIHGLMLIIFRITGSRSPYVQADCGVKAAPETRASNDLIGWTWRLCLPS